MPITRTDRRNLWRKIRQAFLLPLELLMVRLALATIPRFSRRRILRLSYALGGVMMRFSRKNNRVMEANLKLVYKDAMDAAERRRFMRSVWNHVGLVLLDFFWFLRDTHRRVAEYVDIEPSFLNLSRGKEGCIGVSAHLGNWEVVAHAMCEAGRPMTSVFAPIGASRLTQKALLASREANGQHLVAKQGAALHLLRAIREGAIVGLLLDQFTPTIQGGTFVDILGLPGPVSKIAGILHCRRKCPVHVCACIHKGDGRYRAFEAAVLPPDSGLDEEAVTQWIADRTSELIRQYPEQWLWMYRRWRHVAPGTDPSLYPFYAHPYNPFVD